MQNLRVTLRAKLMINRECLWYSPPKNLTVGNQDVHVWRAALDAPTEYVQQMVKILSSDEQQRADRFYFDRDRRRFIIGRGLLRTILGRYLSIEPSRVQFCYEPRGKPVLADVDNQDRLQFNLSHSQGLAVYAIACNREIGIDLEQIRPFPNAEEIAKRFFSVREFTEISILSPEQQQTAFFKTWTCKEAYLKATGDGLAGSLNQVEVMVTPGEPVRLLSIRGNSQIASGWSLYELKPASDYIAALAVAGQDWNLTCWEWGMGDW